jgi:hypothetical protein
MNLTDKEILELNDLCNGVVDGTLAEPQRARLSQWLASSEAARHFYVRAIGLSASLYSYAGEMQAEAPDAVAGSKITRLAFRWGLGSLAIAASIVLLLWITARPKHEDGPAGTKSEEIVARLTGSKECQWLDHATVQPGDQVHRGQRLELAGGFAEITFDSGAQIVLEGPGSLEINSAWDATLRRGTLKATVPPEAIGFRISNPSVEVVDLGTEFTMIADATGSADVLVLKGAVEAAPRGAADQQTVVLRENESRRFGQAGVFTVRDRDQKFARLTRPLQLQHFAPAVKIVHWSFDEAEGGVLKAEGAGSPLNTFDARLNDVSETELPGVRTDGRRERALRFEGKLFAKAPFPGISGNAPHTAVFWVKVPEGASLSEAYAMVAWGTNTRKLGAHPVHIGWNRNPAEGPVGVLRTDYAGGFALGTTSLRDGRWHHVAVVFEPGEDPETPVAVKQYVDGRFEGEGHPSPPVATRFTAENTAAVVDAVWLGCRLGNSGPRKDRFRGEMDEFFLADGALGPREIVQLMKENQLPADELAAIRK